VWWAGGKAKRAQIWQMLNYIDAARPTFWALRFGRMSRIVPSEP
jgi:hypothetical protein